MLFRSIIFISDSLNFSDRFLCIFFSETTTVNSPFGCFSNNSNSSTFFLINSSYIFVISLQKTIFLPAKFFFISGMILLIFFGEIKKTKEFSNSENFFNSLDNCCFLSGKKPQNKNLSEKPLIETAAAIAEGPGIGKILMSLLDILIFH